MKGQELQFFVKQFLLDVGRNCSSLLNNTIYVGKLKPYQNSALNKYQKYLKEYFTMRGRKKTRRQNCFKWIDWAGHLLTTSLSMCF